jgi:chorismate synthase
MEHVPNNPFFAANASDIARLEAYMDQLRKDGDSCGARVDVVARGVPVGLGEPLYDKLDADIARAMMGINAVKGVEIGAGFKAIEQRGTTHGDELTPAGLPQQQRRRRPRRHLDRPGHHRLARDQADQLDPQPAPLDRLGRQGDRRRDARPP